MPILQKKTASLRWQLEKDVEDLRKLLNEVRINKSSVTIILYQTEDKRSRIITLRREDTNRTFLKFYRRGRIWRRNGVKKKISKQAGNKQIRRMLHTPSKVSGKRYNQKSWLSYQQTFQVTNITVEETQWRD